MHKEQVDYIESVKSRHPKYFNCVSVLDVGSQDINGNNRRFFSNSQYLGLDIGEGRNVDVTGYVHEWAETCDKEFDVVISGEMLEHDMYWEQSILSMYKLVKSGGLLLITCASIGRPEHGTRASSSVDSPFTNDYYRNISREDMEYAIRDLKFSEQETIIGGTDLYFFGLKP